jgi:hypothetical protein
VEENQIEVKQVSEKEFLIGPHKFFIDEDNIQNIIIVGDNDERLVIALKDISAKFANTSEGRLLTLVDLNRAGQASSEMRRMGRTMMDDATAGKTALFGLHPVARVIASFVIGATRNKNVGFFKTRDEAVTWLKEK